jgi:hypothetical protein
MAIGSRGAGNGSAFTANAESVLLDCAAETIFPVAAYPNRGGSMLQQIVLRSAPKLSTPSPLDIVKLNLHALKKAAIPAFDMSSLKLAPEATECQEIQAAIRKVKGPLTVAALAAALAESRLDRHQGTGTVCLQPGTDNPYHWGHASAGLAARLTTHAVGHLVAVGGLTPDKPFASTRAHRYQMALLTAQEINTLSGGRNTFAVTPVRQLFSEVFKGDLWRFGSNGEEQRSMLDILAFLWLFEANPKVTWHFVIGADKFDNYARKNEQQLLRETLYDRKMKVVWLERAGFPVTEETVAGWPAWLRELWQEPGFFLKNTHPSHTNISATKIRNTIQKYRQERDIGTQERLLSELSEDIPRSVLNYVLSKNLDEVFYLQAEYEALCASVHTTLAGFENFLRRLEALVPERIEQEAYQRIEEIGIPQRGLLPHWRRSGPRA